jgi:AraC family transcriptional regulator
MKLDQPREVQGSRMLIAGLRGHFDSRTRQKIPELWQRAMHHLETIPGKVGAATFGLCFVAAGESDRFDYLAGVEVVDSAALSGELSRVIIPAQKYAVFPHRAHVSKIQETVHAIFAEWLPKSGHDALAAGPGAPTFFERYSEIFDPRKGEGGIEIWLPIGG